MPLQVLYAEVCHLSWIVKDWVYLLHELPKRVIHWLIYKQINKLIFSPFLLSLKFIQILSTPLYCISVQIYNCSILMCFLQSVARKHWIFHSKWYFMWWMSGCKMKTAKMFKNVACLRNCAWKQKSACVYCNSLFLVICSMSSFWRDPRWFCWNWVELFKTKCQFCLMVLFWRLLLFIFVFNWNVVIFRFLHYFWCLKDNLVSNHAIITAAWTNTHSYCPFPVNLESLISFKRVFICCGRCVYKRNP